MVLKRISIQDFLSIRAQNVQFGEQINVDLDKKVTILLGANDHGKSNILRALCCLNTGQSIKDDERNWDSEGQPSISYEFSLSSEELKAFKDVLAKLLDASTLESADEVAAAAADSTSAATVPNTLGPATNSRTDDDSEEEPELEHLAKLKELRARTTDRILFSRVGVDTELMFEEMPWNEVPEQLSEFLEQRLPRVELFQPTAGTLQDSVTAEQIGTEEFEFLQGVFFYAGLNPIDCKSLFVQNDATERRLDTASKQLDSELRRIWAQGVDLGLQFELRHRTGSIEFLANDPAVRSRKTRMSKRSAGVTQFFRLSMVLHARRRKHEANSYIFLFDEPGIYLHPKGQKDLMQVFEQLSSETQIIYATHSLFLLNQNYPERHRLIVRDERGTKVDQKPYRANWRLATDALGVQLTANILFSPSVLLVEGDSDPLYIYELFRQLNRMDALDADANMLGVYSFERLSNLRYLLQTFARGYRDSKVAVLCDGDKHGKSTFKAVKALCETLDVPRLVLADNRVIEDYILDEECFVKAAVDAIRTAAEAESIVLPHDFEKVIDDGWKARDRNAKKNAADWFKEVSTKLVKSEASKVALARNYAFHCREKLDFTPDESRKAKPLKLCQDLIVALSLPGTRAKRVIETSAGVSE